LYVLGELIVVYLTSSCVIWALKFEF
jgi:hypothetical protein